VVAVGAYVIRRVLMGIVMVIAMSLVTFVLFFASPVDPARFACGKNCSPALIEQTRVYLGYDAPVLVQWKEFVVGIFQGREYPDSPAMKAAAPETIVECPAPCLGYSRVSNALVTDKIVERFPLSFSLALAAFFMWMTGGILFGIIAALKRGTIIDRGVVGVSLLLYAFPSFFIGLFILKFFAIKWQLVPIPEYTSISEGGVGLWLQGLLLPGLTLALLFMALYVRMTRSFVLETMTEDYVRTANAKGLAPRKVLWKHTMRAAVTPLVTMAGLDFAALIGTAIITETVFNYAGLGALSLNAAQALDLPMTIGIVLVLATLVITANIVVDLLYAVIDPRVRVG
jgi:peptide/nickel transport system permease protein